MSAWNRGCFVNYHTAGTHSSRILLSEILIRQESIEGSLWFSCSQVVFFFFFLSLGNRKQKQSYVGLKGWARVAGSLVLGAGARGAEVFLAMQGRQHILF